MGQRTHPVPHLLVDTAEWLFEHLCRSRQIPDTAFPPLAPFFIPIIGSCMLVESLSAPYDSLNGGEGVEGVEEVEEGG